MLINPNISILGYGIEGKATEAFLHSHGYKNITVLDENTNIKSKSPQIVGEKIWDSLKDFDFIFRSPGIHPFRNELKNFQNKLTSHVEYFMEKCPCPIIGITGTKGKGTTSSLINNIINKSGKKSFLGGNIGEAPLKFLDKINSNDFVVLELSSFQTFTFKKSPHISVILMVTQEHLDYHNNIEEYHSAKAQMVKNQNKNDYCIFNKDFDASKKIADKSLGIKIGFSIISNIKNDILFYKDDEVIKTSDISLPGEHNYNNVLAAIYVAKILNISNDIIKKSINEFTGLPLRIETIAKKNNIHFVNDSFSTTPETTIAALKSFSGKNIAVMVGGSYKGSNYSELAKLIANNKNIFSACYGKMGSEIEQKIQEENGKNTTLKTTFDEAFNSCVDYLKRVRGGICLLSPACASFDIFKNYKERGKRFNELVNKIQ